MFRKRSSLYFASAMLAFCGLAWGCQDGESKLDKGKLILEPAQELVVFKGGAAQDYRLKFEGALVEKDVLVSFSTLDSEALSIEPKDLILKAGASEPSLSFQLACLKDETEAASRHVVQLMSSSLSGAFDQLSLSFTVLCQPPKVEPEPDEKVSILLNQQRFELSEGQQASLSFTLDKAVTASVLLKLSVDKLSELSLVPSEVSFTMENWSEPQSIVLKALEDQVVDGDQEVEVQIAISSDDARYQALALGPVKVKVKDGDEGSGTVKFRAMAANITSGNKQSYDEPHGRRIFQAMKPDIVLIQEFNYNKGGGIRSFVDEVFGPEFYYSRGGGNIPNGVISRFPILSYGKWSSNMTSNRDWDWAIIDLPGKKNLFVVSVHLQTDKNAKEMGPLTDKIRAKIREIGEHYILLGGDFNTNSRGVVNSSALKGLFVTSAPYPADQNGNDSTNRNRNKPYDWLLCDPSLCAFEVPALIGTRSYDHGHVFDSRVYSKLHELDQVAPVQAKDSESPNMQHMAVIRDFEVSY